MRAATAAAGNYRCENVAVTARMVETTRRPLDFSPGAGLAGCFFASETHASRIAEISQSDPLEWKLRNLDPQESPLPELLTRVGDSLGLQPQARRLRACQEAQNRDG